MVAGFTIVPLPPVMLDTAPWIAALRELLEASPKIRFAIGMNNVSHLAVADALAGPGNAWFFADVFLYAANRWTVSFLAARVPRLLFAYRWIEEAAVAAAAGRRRSLRLGGLRGGTGGQRRAGIPGAAVHESGMLREARAERGGLLRRAARAISACCCAREAAVSRSSSRTA